MWKENVLTTFQNSAGMASLPSALSLLMVSRVLLSSSISGSSSSLSAFEVVRRLPRQWLQIFANITRSSVLPIYPIEWFCRLSLRHPLSLLARFSGSKGQALEICRRAWHECFQCRMLVGFLLIGYTSRGWQSVGPVFAPDFYLLGVSLVTRSMGF